MGFHPWGYVMSRLFGTMKQVGIVVRDIDKAMHHWAQVCGVGPWFYTEKLPLTSFQYGGEHFDDIHLSIALANSGDIQLELIQQRCDRPSMYRDFLNAGHEGMQHWSSWPENYDDLLDAALQKGYQIGHQGNSPRGRFVYLAAQDHPGSVIEMAELTPTRSSIFNAVKEAARDWDGTDPIRYAWPE